MVDNSTSSPRVGAFSYFNLNRSVLGFDRPHNLQATNIWELPFGRGKKWASSGSPQRS